MAVCNGRHIQRIVVLTGAGVSAESGVPTFREAQTGLWAKYDPLELATPEAFRKNPKIVWDWYEERRDRVRKVSPHAGHLALVEMEDCFDSLVVVTQNVDNLHQDAGSTKVIELHGNIMLSICSETGKKIEDSWIESNPGHPPASPHHPRGLARPGVVWFGEQIPEKALNASFAAAADCDVFLSVGTSSLVYPAAGLGDVASESGAVTIEVNPSATDQSESYTACLRGNAGVLLPQLVESLAH